MTWEQRMSVNAKARTAVADAERFTREDAERRETDLHYFHHRHHRGNMAECSCGQFLGVFSIAIDDETIAFWETNPCCQICGAEGVVGFVG